MAAFSSLTDRLSNAFKHLKSKGKLSEADIDGTIREIRRALLDADVALDVVRSFTGRIRERALGTEVSQALNPAQQVVKIVNEELTAVLGAGVDRPLNFAKNPPTIIMLAGLQGAGKTTLAGKLGYWLKDSGHTPLLVAADLQRPNAVTQLQVVGERAGVPVYAPEKGVQSDGGEAVASPGLTTGDPVKVARDAVALAKQKLYDTVIIDTAGRLGVDEELMKQARDIRDAVQPNEILFVIDAMIGQDAVQTAKAFDEGVDFTGVVLSKLDGDARGGAALSVASVTGKPILFASTGEGLKDFEVFHPDRMASRILDMGDILTLIEQAQKQFDEEEARKAAIKISDGSFGLTDRLDDGTRCRHGKAACHVVFIFQYALFEKFVSTGRCFARVNHYFAIVSAYLFPVVYLPPENVFQLLASQLLYRIGGMHHHGKSIVGYNHFVYFFSGSFYFHLFAELDGA